MTGVSEPAIRRALLRKRAAAGLVVEELGILHGAGRVDVAFVGRSIHGYEIKSDDDGLARLDRQIALYRRALPRASVVATEKHLNHVKAKVPRCFGLLRAVGGPRGGVRIQRVRRARRNAELEPFALAHLLWHGEAVSLLVELGHPQTVRHWPRRDLYLSLCAELSVGKLVKAISSVMATRADWRQPLAAAEGQ